MTQELDFPDEELRLLRCSFKSGFPQELMVFMSHCEHFLFSLSLQQDIIKLDDILFPFDEGLKMNSHETAKKFEVHRVRGNRVYTCTVFCR